MDEGRWGLELWKPIRRLLKYSRREDEHLSQGSGVRMWRKMNTYLSAIRTKPSDWLDVGIMEVWFRLSWANEWMVTPQIRMRKRDDEFGLGSTEFEVLNICRKWVWEVTVHSWLMISWMWMRSFKGQYVKQGREGELTEKSVRRKVGNFVRGLKEYLLHHRIRHKKSL